MKQYINTVETCNKVIELDSNIAYAWVLLGKSLYELERYEEALYTQAEAVKIAPDNPYILERKAYYLFTLNRYEETLDTSNKVIEIDPEHSYAWDLKGRSLYRMERHEEALHIYLEAIKLLS